MMPYITAPNPEPGVTADTDMTKLSSMTLREAELKSSMMFLLTALKRCLMTLWNHLNLLIKARWFLSTWDIWLDFWLTNTMSLWKNRNPGPLAEFALL